MKVVPRVLAAAFEIAWKCGMIATAVALLPRMGFHEDDELGCDTSGRDSTRLIAVGDELQVPMTMLAGEVCSKCTLLDGEGNQLLQANYHRSGSLWVRVGDAFPVRSSFTVTPSGEFNLGARDDERRYEMLLRPSGTSSVWTTDIWWNDFHGLGYTKDGRLVIDPLEIWAIRRDDPGSSASQAAQAPAARTEEPTSAPSSKSATAAGPAPTVVPTGAGEYASPRR